jgi:hypothetical protein
MRLWILGLAAVAALTAGCAQSDNAPAKVAEPFPMPSPDSLIIETETVKPSK